MQVWPFSVHIDRLPAEDVRALSVSSLETLQINLSPACFQSVRDVMELLADLRGSNNAATPSEDVIAAVSAEHGGVTLDIEHNPRVKSQSTANLFEIVNRTGVGLACFPALRSALQTSDSSHMPLKTGIEKQPLTFVPSTENVHVPDFGRQVRCSRLPKHL